MDTRADILDDRRNVLRTLWQPAGVVYFCFCLTGLAVGLWHSKIVPLRWADHPPLPTLQTLAFAQVFFFLLIYPIILVRRQQGVGSGLRGETALRTSSTALRTTHFELLCMFLVTLPLYFLTAWLGDATGKDVLRTILAVAAFCPLGVVASRLLAKPVLQGAVMLTLLLIVLGLPAVWYICEDFLSVSGDWAEHLSPLMFVWRIATAQDIAWLPQPIWAWLTWPILAATGGVGLWTLGARNAK